MEFQLRALHGQQYIEGTPGQPMMQQASDVITVIEECFANEVRRVLIYSENLTERFFDLKSGDAGEILQKLRNYNIRLAVVRAPALVLNQRFQELLIDEQRGSYFRLFDDQASAQEWLASIVIA
jgi:hypothetical protein